MLVLMAWIGWRGALPATFLLLALVAMLGGSLLVALRRWPRRPARFSGGRFQILPACFCSLRSRRRSSRFGEFGWLPGQASNHPAAEILAALALVLLAAQVAWGPLKHIVAGTLHLIAHPRPARFGAVLPVADLAAARSRIPTARR